MRTPALLPDEKRLSFVPLLRIILLSNQGSERLIQVLDNELSAMKMDALEMKPYIDDIVNENRYPLSMDINYHNHIPHRF